MYIHKWRSMCSSRERNLLLLFKKELWPNLFELIKEILLSSVCFIHGFSKVLRFSASYGNAEDTLHNILSGYKRIEIIEHLNSV